MLRRLICPVCSFDIHIVSYFLLLLFILSRFTFTERYVGGKNIKTDTNIYIRILTQQNRGLKFNQLNHCTGKGMTGPFISSSIPDNFHSYLYLLSPLKGTRLISEVCFCVEVKIIIETKTFFFYFRTSLSPTIRWSTINFLNYYYTFALQMANRTTCCSSVILLKTSIHYAYIYAD